MHDDRVPVVRLRGLDAFYGKSQALHAVDLTVERGEVLAVVGRNGAGKTTLMNTVVGLLRRSRGTVELEGRDITGWPTHRRIYAGLGYVPAAARLFKSLTVVQNLMVASPRGQADERVDRALSLLPPLRTLADRRAGALSGGERQMVAIARAVIREPSLLLLDEPTEGLSPLMVDQVTAIIGSLVRTGVTMVVCEQNTTVVDRAATRVVVVEKGRLLHEHEGGATGYRKYLGIA